MIRRQREANLFEILSSSRQKDDTRSSETSPWYRRGPEAPAPQEGAAEGAPRDDRGVAGAHPAEPRGSALDSGTATARPARRTVGRVGPVPASETAGTAVATAQPRLVVDTAVVDPAVGDPAIRPQPALPRLAETDDDVIPPVEPSVWTWGNETVQVRRAVVVVVTVGVLLAICGAYMQGREHSSGRVSYSQKSDEPVLVSTISSSGSPKEPLRFVQTQGAPVPGTQRPKISPASMTATNSDSWRVDIAVSDNRDGVDKLLTVLGMYKVTLQEAKVVTIPGAKGKRFRVYYGPFTSKVAAEDFLERVRAFKGDVPQFGDAYVIQSASPKKP